MDTPQPEFYPRPWTESLMVLFRIISHESRDKLQDLHEALSGSRVKHVLYGIYALIIPPGGARGLAK